MSTRLFNPAPQFFYNGTPAAPLAGGLLYFYEPGTTTPKNTYSDNALSTANSNPVVLSASGVMSNVFLNGAYRVILKDKDGVQQWDRDSVNSIADIVGNTWDSTITYGVGGTNVVYASDGNYYVSIQANNLGHEPANNANPTWWKNQFDYLAVDQQIVAAKSIAVGNATTGLTGVSISNGRLVIGDTTAGIASLNTTAKGTIAVGNGTTTTTLAVGTNNYVLTADSAQTEGIKWAAASTSGVVLLATLTPTAAANVDFLSTFSSSYSLYLIEIEGVLPASNDQLYLRLATGGAADTGSNYANGANWQGAASYSVTATNCPLSSGGNVLAAGKGISISVFIRNCNDATNLKTISYFGAAQSAGGPDYFNLANQGVYFAANTVSGGRLYWSGGNNFSATGKVRIYGYLN